MTAPVRGLWVPGLALGLAFTGCNTGAIGIKECREIEAVRCQASIPCELGDIVTDQDVDECLRFYQNQCLHGIAGPKAPTAKAQKDCVDTIEAAAKCAGKDQDGLATECAGVAATTSASAEGGRVKTVCDVVGRPWDLTVCEYLLPVPDGQGGSAG